MRHLSERLEPAPFAKFFLAISSAIPERHLEAEAILGKKLGPLDLFSSIYCFSDFTSYYDAECGGPCWKYFISIERLFPADKLVSIKLFAEKIQQNLASKNGEWKRTVNLDPGYINGWQVVLSTVKNHSHRIYLSSGVFAEVTLLYRKSDYVALPWTYSDYQAPEQREYFRNLRARYIEQV